MMKSQVTSSKAQVDALGGGRTYTCTPMFSVGGISLLPQDRLLHVRVMVKFNIGHGSARGVAVLAMPGPGGN